MVASGVLERNAGEKDGEEQEHAARREDGYPTTRERASAEVAPPPSSRTLAPSRKGEEPNVDVIRP